MNYLLTKLSSLQDQARQARHLPLLFCPLHASVDAGAPGYTRNPSRSQPGLHSQPKMSARKYVLHAVLPNFPTLASPHSTKGHISGVGERALARAFCRRRPLSTARRVNHVLRGGMACSLPVATDVKARCDATPLPPLPFRGNCLGEREGVSSGGGELFGGERPSGGRGSTEGASRV